tara:strand:- start:38 stop:868 length:831 start_codon:yes stop_codon:yes gene_type:complete
MKNFFHVGFFHSGSTFIQKNILYKIDTYNTNLRKDDIDKNRSRLPKNFGKFFFAENKSIYSDFNKIKRPFIYSSEAFSVPMEHPSFYEKKNKNKLLQNPRISVLNLISYLVTNQKDEVIIIIRKQTDLINSYYKRLNKFFKNENEIFIDFPYKFNSHKTSSRNICLKKYGQIYIDSLDFREFVGKFSNFIDKKRIHILPYELLKFNGKTFLNKFEKIINIKLNKNQIPLKQIVNKSPDTKRCISKNFEKKIFNEFKSSNYILDKTYKLGLKKFGYY